MRIRKHAKISSLLYAAASLKADTLLQTHVCLLNQSPWDVIAFSPPSSPPPPFQVNGSDVATGSGSSEHCVLVSESLDDSSRRLSEVASILCCKTDGKSWQCRREAVKGNSLCEHHSSLVKSKKPKKTPAASSSNPYEFYYYSGFGPRWSKRRGETCKNSNGTSMLKNVQMEAAAVSHIVIEDFDCEDDDDEDEEEESRDNGKKRVRKRIKARSLKSLL